MEQSLAGKLLLAAPMLRDPNFARSVVLMGFHNEEGAMGVVLNRPSPMKVHEAVPQLLDAVDGEEPVFVGGPVQPESVVLLAEFTDERLASVLLIDRVGFPAADSDLAELAGSTSRARVFAGYAGWSPEQLDEEIGRGDWIAGEAQPGDVFSDRPEQLWSRVLTRMGGSYALVARMPLDPSLN